jgi:5-methylcytosine-specific restriction protein B
MFSPKVLDRANTIEFRVPTSDLNTEARKPVMCAPGPDDLVRGFLEVARDQDFHLNNPHSQLLLFRDAVLSLHSLMANAGLEFGHRVFFEAMRFAAMFQGAGGASWEEALDFQVLQKVLPRLHGSRRHLEPTLNTLAKFCTDLSSEAGREGDDVDELLSQDATVARLPRSLAKIKRMLRNLKANQFASFTD